MRRTPIALEGVEPTRVLMYSRAVGRGIGARPRCCAARRVTQDSRPARAGVGRAGGASRRHRSPRPALARVPLLQGHRRRHAGVEPVFCDRLAPVSAPCTWGARQLSCARRKPTGAPPPTRQLDRAMMFEKARTDRDPRTITHRLRGPYLAGLPAPGREGEQPAHPTAGATSDIPRTTAASLGACCSSPHGTARPPLPRRSARDSMDQDASVSRGNQWSFRSVPARGDGRDLAVAGPRVERPAGETAIAARELTTHDTSPSGAGSARTRRRRPARA